MYTIRYMKAFIDSLLDRVTMYRLMLYYLVVLVVGAIALSVIGVMPYDPFSIIGATVFLAIFSYVFNWFFAVLFRAKQNFESQFITALILALIIGPVSVQAGGTILLFVAAFAAMGSKYMFAYKKMHLFNPAAVGALVAAFIFNYGSSWWVGSPYLFPIIASGGLLVAHKIRRLKMVGLFVAVFVVVSVLAFGISRWSFDFALQIVSSPRTFVSLLFFAFVMLVEPMTSPRKQSVQYQYAALVAVCAVVYSYVDTTAPFAFELALISGNIFNRAFAFDPRVVLTLRKKELVAHDTMSFWFEPSHPVSFMPGQFMQWEVPHRDPDNRGTRRFFTVCSSPTERRIMLVTKFSDPSSTYKVALRALREQDEIVAMGVAGDFILPEDTDPVPCVFIAGGIGITPFRSMVRYMLDKKIVRPITLLYSNKTVDDIAFRQLFDEAGSAGWLKTVYTVTETAPYGWKGRIGFITADIIREEVPDYADRLFYISGPKPMVAAFQKMLGDMGIPNERIKTDFFPGYMETHQAKDG